MLHARGSHEKTVIGTPFIIFYEIYLVTFYNNNKNKAFTHVIVTFKQVELQINLIRTILYTVVTGKVSSNFSCSGVKSKIFSFCTVLVQVSITW